MKEVADATAPIAEAAAREAWPYKKVLLAVLPPTLALMSVVIGVWDNGRRDRTALAEAEKDRVAAAEEAEKNRAAEVAEDQAEAESQRKLREAEIVLPKYEALLQAVHATTSAADRCNSEISAYLRGQRGLSVSVGTGLFLLPDGRAFHAGTYYPPRPMPGRP